MLSQSSHFTYHFFFISFFFWVTVGHPESNCNLSQSQLQIQSFSTFFNQNKTKTSLNVLQATEKWFLFRSSFSYSFQMRLLVRDRIKHPQIIGNVDSKSENFKVQESQIKIEDERFYQAVEQQQKCMQTFLSIHPPIEARNKS